MDDGEIYFHQFESMEDNETLHTPRVARYTIEGMQFNPRRRRDYDRIRKALVTHFRFQWQYGQLDLPKRFGGKAKELHPMNPIQHAVLYRMYPSVT